MTHLRQTQLGFSMVAAIFLLVVMAALGAFMVTFSNTQQLTSAQDVQGSRVYWAARGGLEWGISKVLTASACPLSQSSFALDGFNLSVTLTPEAHDEGGTTITECRVISTATSGGSVGSVGYIDRSLTASIEF